MKVQVSGIVEEVITTPKGTQICTILDRDGGKLKFSAKDVDISKMPILQPVEVNCTLTGRQYQNQYYLSVEHIQVKPVAWSNNGDEK